MTHRGQEQRAAYHCENQGFPFYLPQILTPNLKGGLRREYLFPGWIFIRINAAWRCLCFTRGIRRLILAHENPSRIPEREFNWLRSREVNGYIDLPPPYESGDSIMIRGGLFRDCLGIVKGMPAKHRVLILIQLLGQAVELELDVGLIAAA